MYRIGTVARLAQVSVRTLRHYDEIEVYVDCDGPRDTRVTELQVLLEPRQPGAATA